MAKKIEHLKMIEGVINRMGQNSFLLKGWAIGVMIAIFAFAGKGDSSKCILLTIVPLFIFWLLDSYYLFLEKKYRLLYDNVRFLNEKEIDFTMNPNNVEIKVGDINEKSYFAIIFSKTEILFYITCITTTLLIYFYR